MLFQNLAFLQLGAIFFPLLQKYSVLLMDIEYDPNVENSSIYGNSQLRFYNVYLFLYMLNRR